MKTLILTLTIISLSGCFNLNPLGLNSNITDLQTSTSIINSMVEPALSFNKSFLAGNKELSIKGNNFTSKSTVKIGDKDCLSQTFVSSQEIKCVIPAVSFPQTVSISVSTQDEPILVFTNALFYKTDFFDKIETISGFLSPMGADNGVGNLAKFYRPVKPIVVGNNLYVSDGANHTIRKVDLTTMTVSTLAGKAGEAGEANGVGENARFNNPAGMAYLDGYLYVADAGSCLIRKVNVSTRSVSTILGVGNDCDNPTDGFGTNAKLSYPQALEVDSNALYIGEQGSIRKYTFSFDHLETILLQDASYPDSVLDMKLVGSVLYLIDFNDLSTYTFKKLDLNSDPMMIETIRTLPTKTISLEFANGLFYMSNLNKIISYNESTNTLSDVIGSTTRGNSLGIGTAVQEYIPGGLWVSGNDLFFTSLGNNNIKKMNLSTKQVSAIAGSDL